MVSSTQVNALLNNSTLTTFPTPAHRCEPADGAVAADDGLPGRQRPQRNRGLQRLRPSTGDGGDGRCSAFGGVTRQCRRVSNVNREGQRPCRRRLNYKWSRRARSTRFDLNNEI